MKITLNKGLAVVTTVCAVIGAIIAVRQCSSVPPSSPSVDLVATVSMERFRLPFIVEERFSELSQPDNFQKEIDASKALAALNDKKLREKITTDLAKHLSEYMFNNRYYVLFGAIGPGKPIVWVEQVWKISLENKGNLVS